VATNKAFLKWFYERWSIPKNCQTETLELSQHFKNSREVWDVATERMKKKFLQTTNSDYKTAKRVFGQFIRSTWGRAYSFSKWLDERLNAEKDRHCS
jgi:hypothetical protein